MNLHQARRLKKNDRVLWENEESKLPVYKGRISEKTKEFIVIQWDDKGEGSDTAYLDEDEESTFFVNLTRINKC